MTQEDKELLVRDLSTRLPYGVKIQVNDKIESLQGINVLDNVAEYDCCLSSEIEEVKPYLFPLSSMTEEQEEELITITNGTFRYMWGDINNAIPRKNTSEWGISENAFIYGIKVINILYKWLLKNHFDVYGLIEKSLALDATGLNIY